MASRGKCKVCEGLADVELVTRALQEGVRQALRRHRLLGQPVVVMRGGQVVWVKPEDIPIDATDGERSK